MEAEKILGGFFTVILAGITWWINTVWGQQKEQREKLAQLELRLATEYRTKKEDESLRREILDRLDRIGNLELLLAQQYVNRSEFKDAIDSTNIQLSRIEGKLDRKQDRD